MRLLVSPSLVSKALVTVNNGCTCCCCCSVFSGSNISIHILRFNIHRRNGCTFSVCSISFLAAFTNHTAAYAADMVPFRDLLSWLGMLISKLWLDMSSVSFQQLLQTVSIANVYPDQKTFVDKVTGFYNDCLRLC